MVVDVYYKTNRLVGAAAIEALKYGVDYNILSANQLELSCADINRINLIVDKFGGIITKEYTQQELENYRWP